MRMEQMLAEAEGRYAANDAAHAKHFHWVLGQYRAHPGVQRRDSQRDGERDSEVGMGRPNPNPDPNPNPNPDSNPNQASSEASVLALGISGDTTTNLLWRIRHGSMVKVPSLSVPRAASHRSRSPPA